MKKSLLLAALALSMGMPCIPIFAAESGPLDFEQLSALRRVAEARISPDGSLIAYALEVPRRPGVDEDGKAWVELRVISIEGGTDRLFVHGEVNVSEIRFTPGGEEITYLAQRAGDEEETLWAIPVSGGESRRLLSFASTIDDYAVSPSGERIAFLAREPESAARKKSKELGYTEEVFEEDWRPRKLWLAGYPTVASSVGNPSANATNETEQGAPRALDIDGSVFGLVWDPSGKRIAIDVAPRPLIDDKYMLRRVQVVSAGSGEIVASFDNPGKLGRYAFSPNGKRIAMISAADPNDPEEGRLLMAPSAGGALRDLLPGLEGHVRQFAWLDDEKLIYLADTGVETEISDLDLRTGKRSLHGRSGMLRKEGVHPVITAFNLSQDRTRAAFVANSPTHPSEVYTLGPGVDGPRRLTDSNPWLAEVTLAQQSVVTYKARDGLDLQGILLSPLGSAAKEPAPLILIVHGGPEGHLRNGWVTRYSRPGQLAAGRGYAVFYPNYRGSTGRGVEFTKLGQSDAAGKEFDDLLDAVDHLVAEGIADRDRVGITGGSYGGYATAWACTRFTERFRAGVMFVGISHKSSKALTTDIPLEDMQVHTLFEPWTRWQFSIERSPIHFAAQARTPLLIAGGTDDTRVHPSQSLELYRALKMIGKAPVRYVRYPGERHGNRRATARDDYARRLIRWMDHYLQGDGISLPPWELERPN